LFSEAQVDIRFQSDEGGVDDAKSGKLFPGGIVWGADMAKEWNIKRTRNLGQRRKIGEQFDGTELAALIDSSSQAAPALLRKFELGPPPSRKVILDFTTVADSINSSY
jgi:hypothetical protein